ncbi:MAG: CesT family type III secretion system chaperone [Deltaproteobacteria bacterium]|nr:CesT family type III secretion system chaperone [Deltaproteobacteria bacterium]
MSWIDEALRALGKQMGVNNLSFNSRGVCCLIMEKSGKLFIEKSDEDELIVYLERPLFEIDEEVLEKILTTVHYKNTTGPVVSAGIYSDNRLIFISKIKKKDYSLPLLEETIDKLLKLHGEVTI